MGAQESKTVAVNNITQEAITDVMMESSQECSQSSNNNQTMKFSDFNCGGNFNMSGINQKSEIKQNFTCAQDTNQSTDLQAKLQQELKNKLEAATSGIGIGYNSSQSEAYNNISNKIVNNINIKNTAKCMSDAMQNQSLIVEKINARGDCNINNISQQIVGDLVSNCTQSNKALAKAISEAQSKVDNEISASTKGVSGFEFFLILLGIVAMIVVAGIYGMKAVISLVIIAIIFLSPILYLYITTKPTPENYCYASTGNPLKSVFYKSNDCTDVNNIYPDIQNNDNNIKIIGGSITGFNKPAITTPYDMIDPSQNSSKFCYGMSDNNISFLKKVKSTEKCNNIYKDYNYSKTKYDNGEPKGEVYLYTKEQPGTSKYCYGNIMNKDNDKKKSIIIQTDDCSTIKKLGITDVYPFWA